MTDEEKNYNGLEKLNVVRSDVPAITHVDYSARIQSVNKDVNPLYHEIIKAFEDKTGCPVIINTSFNVRDEPIVCTPRDAYLCFMRTEMDYLVLENCLLDKTKQPDLKEENHRQVIYKTQTLPVDPEVGKIEDTHVDPVSRLHKDIRIFGGSFIVILGIITGIAFWRAPASWLTWLWIPVIAIGLPALVYPPAVKSFYRGWMFFASIFGWLISRILLSVFYYIIVSPVALFMKLIGRDYLNLRNMYDSQSNWTEVDGDANDPKHFEHMF